MIDDRLIYMTSEMSEYKNSQKFVLQKRNKNPLVKMIHFEYLRNINDCRKMFLKTALDFAFSFLYK